MKRVILSATLLLFLAGYATAQTGNGGGSNGSRTTGAVSKTSKDKTGKAKKNKSSTARNNSGSANDRSSTLEDIEIRTTAGIDNTREFLYPNGQVSTPTGYEATPVNGGYAALSRAITTTTRKKQ